MDRLATQHFDERYKRNQSESFLKQAERNLDLKAQNFENPIFTLGCFYLKAVYNSYKLKRLLQVARFLFMYSFTTLLFRQLPTEIAIFINICYQIIVSVLIGFPFLGAGFTNIPPTFLVSCEFQTRYSKTLKYSEQCI